jgi:hypothetical protein
MARSMKSLIEGMQKIMEAQSLGGDHGRPRRIVKMAAEQMQSSEGKDWLLRDERGTWEKEAARLIDQVKEKAEQHGLSDSEVDEQIATYLSIMVLQTLINDAKKGSRKRAKK